MPFRLRAFLPLLLLCCAVVRAEIVDGSSYAVSPPEAFVADGAVIVPLKVTAELLGAKLTVESPSFTVTRGKGSFTCTLNKTAATANGKAVTLPKAPFLAGDATYIPLTPLARALNGTVAMTREGAASYVTVTLPEAKAPWRFPLIPLADWKKANGFMANALYVVNLDGSGQRRLMSAIGKIAWPSFSPDGTKLLYVRGGGVYLRGVEQAEETCLLAPGDNIYARPRFTPDGRYILFQKVLGTVGDEAGDEVRARDSAMVRSHMSKPDPLVKHQILRVNPDGSDMRWLADGDLSSVSADGRIIAFTVWTGAKRDVSEMRVMDIDGGGQRALGPGIHPVLTPAGDGVVYGKTFTVGKKIERLAFRTLTDALAPSQTAPGKDDPSECAATYTADGARVLAQARGLVLLSPDRAAVTRLTGNPGDRDPVFTADGQTIVFLRSERPPMFGSFLMGDDEDEENEDDDIGYWGATLVSIKPDGRDELDIVEGLENLEAFAPAPNGKQVIFTAAANLDDDDDEETLKEADGGYTMADVQRYLTEVVPLVEAAAGRKFTRVPDVRLVKRRELVPIMAKESAPQVRMIMPDAKVDPQTVARLSAKSSLPAVLGKYGLDDRALFLLPGNIEPILRVTSLSPIHREGLIKLIIAHELTHALEDQQVGLAAYLEKATSLERMMALSATEEGFAVYVQDRVAEKLQVNSTAREMARLLVLAIIPAGPPEEVLKEGSSSKAQREVYLGGRDFMDWHIQRSGIDQAWAILANPPMRTRVILHPEMYAKDAAPQSDLTPLLRAAGVQLGAKKANLMGMEMGEVMLRQAFGSMDNTEREALLAGIGQASMLVGTIDNPKKKKSEFSFMGNKTMAIMLLATFPDAAQVQRFAPAFEKALSGGKDRFVKSEKRATVAGLTADLNRKRTISEDEMSITIISAARCGAYLLMVCMGEALPDAKVAPVIDTVLKGVNGTAPVAPKTDATKTEPAK